MGRDIAGAAARWYFGDNQAVLQTHRFDSQELLRLSNDQLIKEGVIIGGDPDSVCRGIERWLDLGLDQILLMLGAGRTTHDQVMRALDLLGEKVITRFREPACSMAGEVAPSRLPMLAGVTLVRKAAPRPDAQESRGAGSRLPKRSWHQDISP